MIHWNPDPDILSFGFFHLRWYSLMFLVGFTTGYQIFRWVSQREKFDFLTIEPLFPYVFFGTILGARLGHCLFYEPEYFLSHPLEILMVWKGGLASHGGTLGVIFGIWLFCRRNPQFPFLWILDRMSLCAAETAGLIRIGNMMNSEILGKPTHGGWGFIFDRVDAIPRHPTQLYESAAYLLLFLTLFLIYRKNPKQPLGFLFGISMVWIFAARIVLEYFKENQVPFENGLTFNMGQILSVPFILVGAYLIFRAIKSPVYVTPELVPSPSGSAKMSGNKRKAKGQK